jgi:hypothetical protein
VLAARRGLGVDEHRSASSTFLEAVRWALFAESHVPELEVLREVIAIDPPDALTGAERTQFIANRVSARKRMAQLEALLYPEDEA